MAYELIQRVRVGWLETQGEGAGFPLAKWMGNLGITLGGGSAYQGLPIIGFAAKAASVSPTCGVKEILLYTSRFSQLV